MVNAVLHLMMVLDPYPGCSYPNCHLTISEAI